MQLLIWVVSDVTDFEYSIEALNTRSKFLGVSVLIYVEGDDDEVFWDNIFSKVPNFNYLIESLGGSEEINKCIKKVECDGLNAIIARDSDYLKHNKKVSEKDNIIYTFGYSIENTLYNKKSIYEITRNCCKSLAVKVDEFDGLFDLFSEKFELLLAMDIVNSSLGLGLEVLYDNCESFMSGRVSSTPCDKKISEKINCIKDKIDKIYIDGVLKEIKQENSVVLSIRGHFFASWVSKLINNYAARRGKKISLSGDGLYAAAMTYFSGNFNESHPHYEYYMNAALRAKNSLE